MERKDKEKYATLEASVSHRTVDLGMQISCAMCDGANNASMLVGYYVDMPAVGILPAKRVAVFSPVCYECYVGRHQGQDLPVIPLIHLEGGDSSADTEDTSVF